MDEETLIAEHIVLDPLRPHPEEARLTGSEIAVWQIIEDLKAVKGDVLAVAAARGLSREVVLAVRTYYLRHAEPIDARIRREHAARRVARQAA
jgi:hypothetical protein